MTSCGRGIPCVGVQHTYKCDIDVVLQIGYGPCRSYDVEMVGVPYRF
jgi:hypothetical protein